MKHRIKVILALIVFLTTEGFLYAKDGMYIGKIHSLNRGSRELVVNVENGNNYHIGDTIYVRTEDSIAVMEVTFPMMTVLKCRLLKDYHKSFNKIEKGMSVFLYDEKALEEKDNTADIEIMRKKEFEESEKKKEMEEEKADKSDNKQQHSVHSPMLGCCVSSCLFYSGSWNAGSNTWGKIFVAGKIGGIAISAVSAGLIINWDNKYNDDGEKTAPDKYYIGYLGGFLLCGVSIVCDMIYSYNYISNHNKTESSNQSYNNPVQNSVTISLFPNFKGNQADKSSMQTPELDGGAIGIVYNF